ncbi:ankyrin repeat domain-containing protein [Actinopolymorpha singaporensis]|uniref:Ankyrin repeat-containing protein n=1 Tax=Actinopolymorpha singaporensis TaxID=117157 RepID=A0A1H1RKL2_9ACTN|nr:ankyrin repeat domain-containing protein [Actinopolymorpha singaporensis]SDS36173.1 Ankyrin repeat-containing protein [Actinopolymorpha singaporensis]
MDVIHARSFPPRPSLEQYRKQAKELLKACRAGDPDALERVNRGLLAAGRAHRTRDLSGHTLTDAQFVIAREHGFASWPRFAAHLQGLVDGAVGRYEAAVDAIVTGDLGALTELLDRHPDLVRARSTRTHRATLLHYVAANGVETYRQKTPANAVQIAELLLVRGAEADAGATMYGADDATTMEMLVSSIHPALAGVQALLVDKLVDFGAAVNGPGDDNRPLLTALAHQYPAAAQALVRRGARIDDIVSAAGLGREDLVRDYLDDEGRLRPHVRVVGLRPQLPRRPEANVAWAFVVAAALGHTDVVDFLSRRGADPGARAMAGLTALHWGVVNGHLEVVDLLLAREAPLEDSDNYHHATVLGCAVWAVQNGTHPHRLTIVERLLSAGARVDAISRPTGDEGVDELLRRHGVALG